MATRKEKTTHIVIKTQHLIDYLDKDTFVKFTEILETVADELEKSGIDHRYIVCNEDEPYANDVLNVILKGEDKKNGIGI